jgi:hypothetical protein
MNKRHRSTVAATFLITALFGLGALPALAEPALNPSLDTYSFDIGLQSATTTFTLTVEPYPNGTVSGTPETDGGSPDYYVGLTHGVLTEVVSGTATAMSDPFLMFCVDFNHDISGLPVTYAINIESLFGSSEPDGPPGLGLSMQTLQTQALLGGNFGTTAPTGAEPQLQTDIDAQHEIWNLSYEGNGSAPFTPLNPDMTNLLNTATNALSSNTFSNSYLFDIINPPQGGTPPAGQAFMPITSGGFNNDVTPPAPEPGTLVMLGLGLIGLGSLKLRRSKQ